MKLFNLNSKKEFLKEYIEICLAEWGNFSDQDDFNIKVKLKLEKILSGKYDKLISVLILLEKDKLIGFISLLKSDGEERYDLTPWYGTMYIKEEYRGKNYSKILNEGILIEAKNLGYSKVYLKTNLLNYYEKFGAKIIDKLSNNESLYYIDL